jgi:hypothetical protein
VTKRQIIDDIIELAEKSWNDNGDFFNLRKFMLASFKAGQDDIFRKIEDMPSVKHSIKNRDGIWTKTFVDLEKIDELKSRCKE